MPSNNVRDNNDDGALTLRSFEGSGHDHVRSRTFSRALITDASK